MTWEKIVEITIIKLTNITFRSATVDRQSINSEKTLFANCKCNNEYKLSLKVKEGANKNKRWQYGQTIRYKKVVKYGNI